MRVSMFAAAAVFALVLGSTTPNFPRDADGVRSRRGSAYPWYCNHRPAGELHLEALERSYGSLIEGVDVNGEDVVLTVRGTPIYYRGGRMVGSHNLARSSQLDPIFYPYARGPVGSLPSYRPPQRWTHDFLDALVGSTEAEVRAGCRWVSFLDHRVFVHELCAGPLERVHAEVREKARASREVSEFVSQIKVIYSMKRRAVKGTNNRSYHAYGLALDIIPRSYHGKHVYWHWSEKLVEDWQNIPYSRRWHPPEAVIRAFEENGFVWGGKWYRFDTVHFEYRPEILYLAADGAD